MNEPKNNTPNDAPPEKSSPETARENFSYYYDDGTGYEIYDSTSDEEDEGDCNKASSGSGKP